MEYVIGAFVMWVVLAVLFTGYQKTYSEVLEVVVALPVVVAVFAFAILCFPFLLIWKFVRNAVKGVSQEVWDKAKLKHFKRIGNICFVYDDRARAFQNKFFMVRLVPSKGKGIVHEPMVIYSDVPSVPKGEFRFGEE